MAPGIEKTAEKVKQAMTGEHPEGAPRGHHPEHHGEGDTHGQHEGKSAQSSKLDGKGLRVVIIAARWYGKVVHSLADECTEELLNRGVAEHNLHLMEVAGVFELPFAAARAIHCKDPSHRPDAVVCIGCIVNRSTHMCDTMSQAVANGIMKLNVTSDTPVIFGVLSCESESQAQSCASMKESCGAIEGQKCNHGVSWAQSALEMAHLKRCAAKKSDHCHCIRCASRSKSAGAVAGTCASCGSSAEQCSCKDCKCKTCCDNRGECTSCKSSAGNCSCIDCKCRSCCKKRDLCRGCGCSPDKCSCRGCNCAACSNKESAGMKMPSSQQTMKQQSGSSSEHVTKQHTGSSSASKQQTTPSSAHMSKQQAGPTSSGVTQGTSGECVKCGSPGGKCKCGLLH